MSGVLLSRVLGAGKQYCLPLLPQSAQYSQLERETAKDAERSPTSSSSSSFYFTLSVNVVCSSQLSHPAAKMVTRWLPDVMLMVLSRNE